MPAKTPRMQRAAGAELNRREHGTKRQAHATRQFGSASTQDVRDFARKPAAGYPGKQRPR